MRDDAYATPADYRAAITPDRDNGDDVAIGEDLTAVSRYLEGRLARWFNRDTAVVDRIYTVSWPGQTLRIDDLADLAAGPAPAIQIDAEPDGVFEVDLTPADYELLRYDARQGPDPWPYTEISLPVWRSRSFTKNARVKVSGFWGWPAVPVAVKVAVVRLTSMLRLESAWATRRLPEGMDAAIETSMDAQVLLRTLANSYAKRWVLV